MSGRFGKVVVGDRAIPGVATVHSTISIPAERLGDDDATAGEVPVELI